jgi:sugar phosphate isomerase/epimerase
MVVHCNGGRPGEEAAVTRDIHLAALRPTCEAAAAFGGQVALENVGSWEEWQYLIDLVDRSGIPNLGLNVDTGHAHLSDLGVGRAISSAAQRIVTTHLQDNFGQVDDHLPPGEGRIDWPEALGAFLSVGYEGVYMVEISDCPPNREPDAVGDTRTAGRNLRRFLEELGRTVAPAVKG